MKGIVLFTKSQGDSETNPPAITDFDYDSFPSVAFGSGNVQKEDIYRYAKRNASGEMRRIGYVGYTLRIECKWGLLTLAQYEDLVKLITSEYFYVKFRWQGQIRTEKFYAGNISATPFRLSQTTGGYSPVYYKDVSFPAISLNVFQY